MFFLGSKPLVATLVFQSSSPFNDYMALYDLVLIPV